MVTSIDRYKITYFPIPKVACTSIKMALYELEYGRVFDKTMPDGSPAGFPGIHMIYPSHCGRAEAELDSHPDYWSFAVVRDPVKRLISSYSNRVVHHNDIRKHFSRLKRPRAKEALKRLPLQPDIDTFFARFDDYKSTVPSINHHVMEMDMFLGADLNRIDRVYKLEDIDQLSQDLGSRVTGKPVVFGRFQEGGPKLKFEDLSMRTKERLLEITRHEYEYLGGLYAPPTP